MKTVKRKFVTEYALGFLNTFTAMVPAYSLLSDDKMTQEQADQLSNCHIYAITAIPTVYFKENSLEYKDKMLSGSICYRINGVNKEIGFNNFPLQLTGDDVSISCEYPYKEIKNNKNDRYITSFLVAKYINQRNEWPELNNYEVLYIGQAIGNKTNRSVIDRLRSHSTMQKILARTSHEFPDKEIMIFMYEFKHEQMLTSIDGRASEADNSDKNETRLFNAIDNRPTEKQKIALIEACLIRYFQPYYNQIFKIKFPSIKAKTLDSCYKLDISGLVIEINCDDLNYSLYSPTVNSKQHHIANVDLFHIINRASIFSATGLKDLPGVIR